MDRDKAMEATDAILKVALKYPLTSQGEYVLCDGNAGNFIVEVNEILLNS